jgi:hypothetical protein
MANSADGETLATHVVISRACAQLVARVQRAVLRR